MKQQLNDTITAFDSFYRFTFWEKQNNNILCVCVSSYPHFSYLIPSFPKQFEVFLNRYLHKQGSIYSRFVDDHIEHVTANDTTIYLTYSKCWDECWHSHELSACRFQPLPQQEGTVDVIILNIRSLSYNSCESLFSYKMNTMKSDKLWKCTTEQMNENPPIDAYRRNYQFYHFQHSISIILKSLN